MVAIEAVFVAITQQSRFGWAQYGLLNAHFALDAERSGALLYVATLPLTPTGKWRLVVSDASKDWKLRATLQLPATSEIKLGY